MTVVTRPVPRSRGWLLATVGLALTLRGGALTAAPGLESEIEIGTNYRGSVQSIAFEDARTAWIATTNTLYRYHGGQPQVVTTAPDTRTRVMLAPGGRFYAWLVHDVPQSGLFTVELFQTPDKRIAKLRLASAPYGFSALYLGSKGELIVTKTPLDDPEGLKGDFLYAFWSKTGRMLGKVTLPASRTGVVDVTGQALLLLGPSDAIAYRNNGRELWKLQGTYRAAALAARGSIALLNPADATAINQVDVYRDHRVTRITMTAPVFELALTDDGATGAIAVDEGVIQLLKPRQCNLVTCTTRATDVMQRTGTYQITAMQFVDAKTLAVGAIQRVGTAPRYSYPAGAVAILDASGHVVFSSPVTLTQPTTWAPVIDVSYGVRFFAAHTPYRALFVRVDP